MIDESAEDHSANEIPAECPTSSNGHTAPEIILVPQEVDSAITPTPAISTTEAVPIVDVVVPPVIVVAPTVQPQIELRVNSQHVETLQLQIRLFKNLSQKYMDSTIPKQLDANSRPIIASVQQTTVASVKSTVLPPPVVAGAISLPPQPVKQKSIPLPIPVPPAHTRPTPAYTTPYISNPIPVPNTSYIPPRPIPVQNVVPVPVKTEQKHSDVKGPETVVVAAPPATPLSWQCFSSLMFIGPTRPAEGMISIAPSVRKYTEE